MTNYIGGRFEKFFLFLNETFKSIKALYWDTIKVSLQVQQRSNNLDQIKQPKKEIKGQILYTFIRKYLSI